jgi:hypothetical protein
MRIAFVSAFAAACLVMPAHAALPVDDQGVAAPTQGMQVASDDDFRISARTALAASKVTSGEPSRFAFKKKTLEYYPIEGSNFHFELGFQRDKGGMNAGRAFNFRGDKLFGLNNLGFQRKVSAGFGVAYDKPVGANDKFSLDAGMRRSRNAMASQLIRLAALGGQEDRLGARASRFGPSAHLSFIHSF